MSGLRVTGSAGRLALRLARFAPRDYTGANHRDGFLNSDQLDTIRETPFPATPRR